MASTIAVMSKDAPPSRTAPQFVVRMPDDEFRNKIAEAAKNNNRSMNAEIVARLDESFKRTSDVVTKEELSDLLDKWTTRRESELVAVMSVRTMLANNVVRMFEQLPPERRTESFANAYDFAYALTSSDGKGLEDAVAKILGEDPNGRAAKLAASGLREQETGYRKAALKITKK